MAKDDQLPPKKAKKGAAEPKKSREGEKKPKWTPEEDDALKNLVDELGSRGAWPQIAQRLGTGRSPAAVERHWLDGGGVVERGPPSLGTKRDPVEKLRGFDLYRFEEALDVLYTKKRPHSSSKQWNKFALAAFSMLSEYEDEGPEDGSFNSIDVRSELKALTKGVDVFFYDKNQGMPFDEGVEVRAYWTSSTIYLAPHPDEENAVARGDCRGIEGRSGHAYALVKPKAGGDLRDFEFANYPVVLVVAKD